MTLVATWLNLESNTIPTIWAAADSQISNGEETLTLEGSKIFELQVVCRDITKGPGIEEVYFRTALGFSFAGSSFTGFNTYSTLNVILTNLARSKVEGLLPSHIDILNKCRDILKHYTTNQDRVAEVCIWGFCPVSKLPFIGTISAPDTSGNYTFEIRHGLLPDLHWILLGDIKAKEKFNELILERLKLLGPLKNLDYWRSPFYPLREIIESHEFKGVGGNIQLSMLDSIRFQHISVVSPINPERNAWHLTFKNFDIQEDFGRSVGNLFICINGIFMDFPLS